jgi:YggT family protein
MISANSLNLILSILRTFFDLYLVVIMVRISLTWFPSINWYAQPFYSLSKFVDSYIHMFRGIIPSIVGMDVSPVLAILLLQNLAKMVNNIHAE